MVYNKKAISPVVATALLLVVAVVAVVGFQSWFQTYNSGLTADVEKRSANTEGISVERLDMNSTDTIVWLKNGGSEDQTVEVRVGTCTLASATVSATSVNETLVGVADTCGLTDGASEDVIVVTSAGVYTETEIVR